ncbi:MAG: DUF1573 domain-containing protein [Armatimonadetes bacterium]|nr:DUF1573 domain-containing protein [Armatimonadota bacterium]
MLTLIPALILLHQASMGEAPMVAPGANRAFQEIVLQIEELLEKKDFEGAEKLTKWLPNQEIKFKIDETNLPPSLKLSIKEQVPKLTREWLINGLELTAKEDAANPDIIIRFQDTLPPDPDTKQKVGMAYFFNESTPRLEAIIATKRSNGPLNKLTLENEVQRAIGLYLGVENEANARDLSGMRVQEPNSPGQYKPSNQERFTAMSNYAVGQKLIELIKNRVSVTPARPEIYIDPPSLDFEGVAQGDRIQFSYLVTNRGNAPLSFTVKPDCGCVITSTGEVVKPGGSTLVKASFDSSLYSGRVRKQIAIFSNDPVQNLKTVTVSFMIEPVYTLLNERKVRLMTESGADGEVTVVVNPKKKFKIDSAFLTSLDGFVGFAEWKENGQIGYKLRVHVNPGALPPFVYANVVIHTDNVKLPEISLAIPIQTGILAQPAVATFGEVSNQESAQARVVLSRPGKPFKILSCDTDVAGLHLQSSDKKVSESHTVTLEIPKGFAKGAIIGSLLVKTNDPKQPTIVVPISGEVR